MKRFLSVLLVAILFVTCLSTAAFAAEVVKTGDVKTFVVNVYGDEFSTYKVSVNVGAGLELVSIEAPYVYGTNVGFMNGGNNVTSHSFKVTVRVTADKPGTYSVSATVVDAGKTVTLDDGTKQIVPVNLLATGAEFVIEAPVCDHDWDNGVATTPATCTKDGVMTFTCSKCGETKTEVIPATGHEWGNGVVTKPATCTEDGVKTFTCSKCGETKTEVIPATGHDWDNGVVTTPATCTVDGEKTFTCSVCGETKKEVIPAAHTWETVWSHDAANHWHKCSVCGEKKDVAAHSGWFIIDQLIPTAEKDGWVKFQCGVCTETKEEPWKYGEPGVGDIRPMILMGIAATVTALAAVSYVFKRKNVI